MIFFHSPLATVLAGILFAGTGGAASAVSGQETSQGAATGGDEGKPRRGVFGLHS